MLATIIIAAIATPLVMPAPATALRPLSGPAERFAADVVAGVDAGQRVRLVQVRHQGDAPTLEVVLSDDHRARRYELVYTDHGSIVAEYRVVDVAMPAEDRVYLAAAELVDKLRDHAPGLISEECGSYTLEIGSQTLWLDESNYYVVSARIAGDGADAAAADVLTRSLAAGFDLVDVRGSRESANNPVIELWLNGDIARVVHVVTDRRSRVVLVEVRDRPTQMAYRTYLHRKELLSDLRVGRALHSLVLEPTADGSERLVGVMRSGVRFSVEPGDYRHEDMECGC